MAFIDRDPDRWVYAEYEELRAACLTALAERPTAVEDPFDAYAMLPYEQRVALIERIACA